MTADPIRLALHKALADDATLKDLVSARIYFQVAPQGATYPLVTFHRQFGAPRWTAKGGPVQSDLYAVKGIAVGSGSAETVEEIAEAIDGALNDTALAVTGRDVLLKPLRESDIDYSEVDGDKLYRHRGALYRLMTS
jgi:hypothetical protein